MEIYLDDCSDDDDLVVYLSQAGHTVFTPRSEGTRGAPDPRHLAYAASRSYALLTQNPADFRTLHAEWQAQGRAHSGILLIYQDNIRGKDMELPEIVRALDNLIASGIVIADEIHVLNHWR